MEKLKMLYEGKAKKVYKTNQQDRFIVEYKDDATAFNGEKRGVILNKGIINNQMSALLFKELQEKGIENHFIEAVSAREMLVKAVKILPVEVIVRNIAAGGMAKRLDIEEGKVFKRPVLEFCYKSDKLGDPLINEDHIEALELAEKEEINKIKELALKTNEILQELFWIKKLRLVDFKMEFGLFEGKVILADEISPDTCRLWDVDTNEKLDKDRFRRDLGNVEETYQEVLRRLKN